MNETTREQIALFRYGLIAPLLNGNAERKSYINEITSKQHDIPFSGYKRVSAKTIQEWCLTYRRQGFEGLKPKPRSDRGRSRRLKVDQQDRILELRKTHAEMPVSVFYEWLIKEGEILPHEVSYSTLNRLLRKQDLTVEFHASASRKRFAHDTVNAMWQGDLSHGPVIRIKGKAVKTFLIAFLDDCSRLIPFGQFFGSEKFDGLRTVVKQAIIRRGLPRMIYVDNGKIYRSDSLQLACASLGIVLTHTQPYDPQSKGKIERFFRTVQTRFYPLLQIEPVRSLEELNTRFWHWLETDYHRRPHASLQGQSPLHVFVTQAEQIRMCEDPSALDALFLKRESRKVKQDGTISLNGSLYEVPARYIGQKVEVRYDETGVFLYEEGKEVEQLREVCFADNAHVKRESRVVLSFAGLNSEEGTADV
ncbi:MAG: DDE-type integrase/transposase/recombinase [Halobacteriota archaeon]